MTRVRLPPYPCVPDELKARVSSSLHFASVAGLAPGEREITPHRFIFGTGTDWSVEQHPLRVECRLANPDILSEQFGPNGVICCDARLMIALEWVSSKSSRRGFSQPHLLDYSEISQARDLTFVLEFPTRDLAGNVQLSLELLVGAKGKPGKDERHLANVPGLRLGSISEPWHLLFDGSGSLFPILHVSNQPTDPLWSFSRDWDDPTFDEFTTDFVSLEINTSHPDFGELYGDARAPYSTSLFRQVLASWLMLFLDELQNGAEEQTLAPGAVTQWRAIIEGKNPESLLPGSVAKAAREFCMRGNLDVTSRPALLLSAQRWIDERFAAHE
jgi:hypothetical protein